MKNQIIIPDTLDVRGIVTRNFSGSPTQLKNHPDRLAIILNQLIRARYNYCEKYDLEITDNYTVHFPVDSEILKKYANPYTPYLDALNKEGTLGIGEKHIIGKRCRKYFLVGCEGVRVYTLQNSGIIEKLDNHNVHPDAREKYAYLFSFLEELKIDWDVADKVLSQMDEGIRSYHTIALNRIDSNCVSTFKLGKTGRLYTPISNLHKNLRKSLRFDNLPLVELDIKNSIYYIFLYILSGGDKEKINNILYTLLKNYSPHRVDVNPEYTRRVLDGTIYQYLHCIWHYGKGKVKEKDILNVTSKDRHTAKKKFISLCNQPNSFHKDCKYWKNFSRHFPAVAQTIESINEGYFYTKRIAPRNYDDCPFAYLTQGLESYLLLDVLVPRLSDVGIRPIYTLHDAIYTTPDNVDLVHEIMISTYSDIIGFPPTIKINHL